MRATVSNFIFSAIAAGLWANAAAVMFHSAPATAQEPALSAIAEDIHKIAQGTCHSAKLC